jgi:hypothetical protein
VARLWLRMPGDRPAWPAALLCAAVALATACSSSHPSTVDSLGVIATGTVAKTAWTGRLDVTDGALCTDVYVRGVVVSQGCDPPIGHGLEMNFLVDGGSSPPLVFVYGAVSDLVSQVVVVDDTGNRTEVPLFATPRDTQRRYFCLAGTAKPRDLLALDRSGAVLVSGRSKLEDS